MRRNLRMCPVLDQTTRLVAYSAALMLVLGTGACGDENGNGEEGGSFGQVFEPRIMVNPPVLTFDGLDIGVDVVVTVQIVNIGEGDLVIDEMELATRSTEFSVPDVSLPLTLAPNEERWIDVVYTPVDCLNDEGNLVIHSNDRENQELAVPLTPLALTGQVRVYPNPIDFGRVPSGGLKTIPVSITNAGTCVLEVNDLYISGSFDFTLTEEAGEGEDVEQVLYEPELPFTLETGEEIEIDMTYAPENDGFDEASLIVRSDDSATREVVVPIVANGDQACITVSEEDGIDYGERFIGEVHPKTITITNCSQDEDLLVSDIFLGEHWELLGSERYELVDMPEMSEAEPLLILPAESESLILNFTPILYTSENHEDCDSESGCEIPDGAVMTVISNDEVKSPLEIEISGIGTNNRCPVAQAVARVQGGDGPWDIAIDTIPLAVLEFDGSESYDSEGSIALFQWDAIERPDGSTSEFLPNPNVENPTFFLDLAGQYLFRLRVFDNSGIESCDPADILVIVTPNEAIHVQLVWETPADPDETDGNGSDVDLHFLHPDGDWDTSPLDCFWRNREPDWGVPGNADDNPSLDIDDTDGAGPENINLDNPEGTDAAPWVYGVGVFYFSDHGFGATDATIRIYINGIQQFDLTYIGLQDREFWDVATIEWPSAFIERIHRLYPSGFPN